MNGKRLSFVFVLAVALVIGVVSRGWTEDGAPSPGTEIPPTIVVIKPSDMVAFTIMFQGGDDIPVAIPIPDGKVLVLMSTTVRHQFSSTKLVELFSGSEIVDVFRANPFSELKHEYSTGIRIGRNQSGFSDFSVDTNSVVALDCTFHGYLADDL